MPYQPLTKVYLFKIELVGMNATLLIVSNALLGSFYSKHLPPRLWPAQSTVSKWNKALAGTRAVEPESDSLQRVTSCYFIARSWCSWLQKKLFRLLQWSVVGRVSDVKNIDRRPYLGRSSAFLVFRRLNQKLGMLSSGFGRGTSDSRNSLHSSSSWFRSCPETRLGKCAARSVIERGDLSRSLLIDGSSTLNFDRRLIGLRSTLWRICRHNSTGTACRTASRRIRGQESGLSQIQLWRLPQGRRQ